jgi:hypothetical protein
VVLLGRVVEHSTEGVLDVAVGRMGEGTRHGGGKDEGKWEGIVALPHLPLKVEHIEHTIIALIPVRVASLMLTRALTPVHMLITHQS